MPEMNCCVEGCPSAGREMQLEVCCRGFCVQVNDPWRGRESCGGWM